MLDGALALSLPTKKGQHLTVKKYNGSDLVWKSLDENGEVWFKSKISLLDFSPVDTTDEELSKYITKLLKSAVRLNSEFLSKWNGFKVETNLEFSRDWGLGSSSSLTYAVAEWADIHPVLLHFKVSNGSGYDVACAGADSAILYQVVDDSIKYEPIEFLPSFRNNLYFVHLNKKQSSIDGIKHYTKTVKSKAKFCKSLTTITEEIIETKSLASFEKLIEKHEDIVSKALKLDKVKNQLFSDYWGAIKSLGAWGGDFVLACSSKSAKETKSYFEAKGYTTVIPFEEMVL